MLISRAELVKACVLTREAGPKKEVQPVLSNFKLTPSDDGLSIEATDQELALRVFLKAESTEEGKPFLIPSDSFTAAVRASGDKDIRLQPNGDRDVQLVGDITEYTLPQADVAKYPSWVAFPIDKPAWVVPAGVLETMLARTLYAASGDAKMSLSGTCFDFKPQCVLAVSCNSSHAATVSVPYPAPDGYLGGIKCPVVPMKAMTLLRKVLRGLGDKEEIKVWFRANDVLFSSSEFQLWSRLMNGIYPPYHKMLAFKTDHSCNVDPKELAACLRRVQVVINGTSSRVIMLFVPGRLHMECSGHGTARSSLSLGDHTGPGDWDTTAGKGITSWVNPELLLSMLSACGFSQDLKCSYHSPELPLLLTADIQNPVEETGVKPLAFTYMIATLGDAKKMAEAAAAAGSGK